MVSIKKIHIKNLRKINPRKHILPYLHASFWFGVGAVLGFFFLVSFAYIFFQQVYSKLVFPGVTINNVNFGGKSQAYVENYFAQRNEKISHDIFTFLAGDTYATTSANELNLGYNSTLLAQQAMSVGRSSDIFSNITLVFQAYLFGVTLSPSYSFSQDALTTFLTAFQKDLHKDPVDAQFQFTNGKVTTFKPSSNGQDVDIAAISQTLNQRIPYLFALPDGQNIQLPVPLKTLLPEITTEKANNLGIKELIGTGTSLFQHSIPGRIFNVKLAASRLNGVVIAPNEEFSFDKALGDVSAYTGYQQAYVISGGKTVLGDGGGVCQVSTTMFRAILNAGLPITERHAHDYRVGYYEEDGPPGIDATVYVPSVDLKFKNTTGHNILIQTVVDPDILRLTFYLYGVKDGREVTMTTPVITNETPAPPTRYQDDPTLPKGVTKQVDFSANGATVKFSRVVSQNGKEIINETYVSNYRPWQAVFLVGTQ
ncbi:MAG TPA: VanW family protein [Candidatus Eisenbacteria bacterium]|nr:VanW family protein [Candidatus Eisenbacteria bacterium]